VRTVRATDTNSFCFACSFYGVQRLRRTDFGMAKDLRKMIEIQKLHLLASGLLFVCLALMTPLIAYGQDSASGQMSSTTPHFSDVTSSVGVHFQNIASHTSRKYLI
jgi:hypothetical protein